MIENQKPIPIRRFNTVMEWDPNVDAVYVYFPPWGPKNPPKVTRTVQVDSEGKVILDFGDDSKLVGIEVLAASSVMSVLERY